MTAEEIKSIIKIIFLRFIPGVIGRELLLLLYLPLLPLSILLLLLLMPVHPVWFLVCITIYFSVILLVVRNSA